jgi:hypothetical protein
VLAHNPAPHSKHNAILNWICAAAGKAYSKSAKKVQSSLETKRGGTWRSVSMPASRGTSPLGLGFRGNNDKSEFEKGRVGDLKFQKWRSQIGPTSPVDRQSILRSPLLELKISHSSLFKFPQTAALSGK